MTSVAEAPDATGPSLEERLTPFPDNLALLQVLLEGLDQRLDEALAPTSGGTAAVTDPSLRGLIITPDDLVRLAGRPALFRHGADAPCSLWAGVRPRIAASRQLGIPLALALLQGRFGLTDFEVDCLVTALAPEVDPRYERIFGYLNDDVARRWPTVGLLLRLWRSSDEPPIRSRPFLAPGGRLFRSGLLEFTEEPGAALLARGVRVRPPVAAVLLDEGGVDAALVPCLTPMPLPGDADPRVVAALLSFLSGSWNDPDGAGARPLFCLVRGRPGSGRAAAVQAACDVRGWQPLLIDCQALRASDRSRVLLESAFQDALLYGVPLLLRDLEALAPDGPEREVRLVEVSRLLRDLGWLAFATVETLPAHQVPRDGIDVVSLDPPVPSAEQRVESWRERLALVDLPPAERDRVATELGARFRLSHGEVRSVVRAALRRGPDPGGAWQPVLHAEARRAARPSLGELAQQITPRYTWDELVLPDPQQELLRDIVRQVRYGPLVLERWGLRTGPAGHGLTVLFSGPSGTGKTMAAEVIAGELAHGGLAMDLFRIDLATVVSKYIGETEKNLRRIFLEAATADVLLFFDEADALFGKRTAVKDAHDRYANIEVNYLLQALETYPGVILLATNLRQNLMDDALLRRIRCVVEFPLPAAADRLRIWGQALPATVPREGEIDLEFLARAFELSGGSIRNIGLGAAFLAAEDGGRIGMAHLVRATQRELEKLGKRSQQQQFGPYLGLLDRRQAARLGTTH